MKKLRTLLIDDEPHSSESLKIELELNCPDVEVIGISNSAKDGLKKIANLKPELIFLDIEMPWMNGFELLRKVEEIDFHVVFITAYDQYAIKAFQFSAIDYLLKPVEETKLIEAVNKVVKKEKSALSSSHLDILLQNLKTPNQKFQRLVLTTSEGLEFIQISDIIRVESDSNYCSIFITNGKDLFVAKTLKEMESMLKEYNFHRVHQSHLVNTLFIKRYVKTDGGYLELTDGSQIIVARSRRTDFFNEIKEL